MGRGVGSDKKKSGLAKEILMPIKRRRKQKKQKSKGKSDAIQLSDKLEVADKRRGINRKKSAREKRSLADAVESDISSFTSKTTDKTV